MQSTYASLSPDSELHYLNLLKGGSEVGLSHFYNKHFRLIRYLAFKRVKDELAASSITQEAFLKLWLLRDKMHDLDGIYYFLKKCMSDACRVYYLASSETFHRYLVKLDDIDNWQEFMAGHDPYLDVDVPVNSDVDEEQIREQWKTVTKVIPNLTEDQRLFIKLCLRHSFNYGRIADHLGGLTDYEVAKQVEKAISQLKNILTSSNKLNAATSKKFLFEGELTEEQICVLNMRYELKCSFEEIADKLGLSQSYIQKVFVEGYSSITKKQ